MTDAAKAKKWKLQAREAAERAEAAAERAEAAAAQLSSRYGERRDSLVDGLPTTDSVAGPASGGKTGLRGLILETVRRKRRK